MSDQTIIDNPDEELEGDQAVESQIQEAISNPENEEYEEYNTKVQPSQDLDPTAKFIENNLSVPIRDFIDNTFQGDQRSKEDIKDDRGIARDKFLERSEAFQESVEGTGTSETVKAAVGAPIDAADSVLNFIDLSGDTLKTGMNQLLGKPIDPTQNPFDENYESNEWFDIPDDWKPENKTALGKFGRGLVEFGLVSRWTSVAGGAMGIVRTPGAAVKGPASINFIRKGFKIGSEGAIADLIISSNEFGNIANLAEEHVPWLAPQIMQALAVDPEDNRWLAGVKSVLAGAGMNYIAHAIGGLAKGFYAAGKAKLAGKTIDEANVIGNQAMAEDIAKSVTLDEEAAINMAAGNYVEGRGFSYADPRDEFLRTHLSETEYSNYSNPRASQAYLNQMDKVANNRGAAAGDPWDDLDLRSANQAEEALTRQPDPFVNPDLFDDAEKATYRSSPNAIKKNLREGAKDIDGRSSQVIATESYIRAVANGNKDIKELVTEVIDDMASEAFSKADNTLSHAELVELGFKRAKPYLNEIEAFADGKQVDLASAFKNMLKNPKEHRLFGYENGEIIKTIGPQAKDANIVVLNALGELISNLARGTMEIANDMSFVRQWDALTDAMKVLFVENKKYSMLWGLDGQAQQKGFMGLFKKQLKRSKENDLAEIAKQAEEYFGSLKKLSHEGRFEEAQELIHLFKLTDGSVRTQAHIHEYLQSRLFGGRMVGTDGSMTKISGRFWKEIWGTYFNSILSRPRTGIKAINMTNMVAIMRPLQIAIGTMLPGRWNKEQIALAAVQWDSIFRSKKESWEMAVRNYKLGSSRKNQDYQGKFDLEEDMAQWKALKPYYDKYGKPRQQMAYNMIDQAVDFNTMPWVRYNQNAMGAGDAFARTNIGRQQLALLTAQKGLENGIDLKDLSGWAARNEEAFRNEIFKKNKDGAFIVSDKAARLAGDGAALTSALEENFKAFELLSEIPFLKAFFPFVRPGFNALDLTFQHTPLMVFRNKYRDLVVHGRNLEAYGIRPENLAQEVALIEGRIAMGSGAVTMMIYAAMQGRLIGDLPANKEDRDLWRLNKIQPNSFAYPKPGGGYTYFSFKNIEIFNTLFSMTANIVNNAHTLGEDLTDHWINKTAFITAAVIVDNSMLQGMEGLMHVFDAQSSEELKTRFAGRAIRGFLPFSGASADLGDLTDATYKESQTLLETIGRRDVFIKGFLKPRYDVLSKDRTGKPLQTGPHNPLLRLFNALSPVAITSVDADPIKEALLEIRYNLPDVLAVLDGEPLNSIERSEIERYLSMSKTLRPRLDKIIKSGMFKDALNAYKARDLRVSEGFNYKDWPFYMAVDEVFRSEKKMAKAVMLKENPELKERIEIRKTKKTYGKHGRVDKIDALLNLPK